MAVLEDVIAKFKNLSERVEDVVIKDKVSGEFKVLLKLLYDVTQTEGFNGQNSLPELIIGDFDNEQLWQEIELQNQSYLPCVIDQISKLIVSRSLSILPVSMTDKDLASSTVGLKKAKPLVEEERAVSSEDDLSSEEAEVQDSDDEELIDEFSFPARKSTSLFSKTVVHELDDGFFKVHEMEDFLSKSEAPETETDSNLFSFDADNESENEDPMYYNDFFAPPDELESEQSRTLQQEDEFDSDENLNNNLQSEESEMTDDMDKGDEDDFDPVDGSGSEMSEQPESDQKQGMLSRGEGGKKVRFQGLESDGDDSNDFSEDEEPSNFTKRQQRLRSTIDQLEDEAVAEKPWTMKGEVTAGSRPVNSLLEEFVEFDTVQRPAPVITETTTDKLEDIIRRRIRDRAFDDVERKIKPVAAPAEFKKKLVLDQEKSKLSLAEIYESEYLKQKEESTTGEKEEKDPEEHVDIRKRLAALFRKLDALSDMYFIPRQREPELKIISNTPAATAEDVGPTVNSEAALLAPEEAASSFKRSLLGKEERTKTDKKRERRKKKQLQAIRFKAKAAAAAGRGETTYAEELRKAKKFKNVTTLEERIGGVTKTSRDFFSKLQETQATEEPKKRKKPNGAFNAKKLKL